MALPLAYAIGVGAPDAIMALVVSGSTGIGSVVLALVLAGFGVRVWFLVLPWSRSARSYAAA